MTDTTGGGSSGELEARCLQLVGSDPVATGFKILQNNPLPSGTPVAAVVHSRC